MALLVARSDLNPEVAVTLTLRSDALDGLIFYVWRLLVSSSITDGYVLAQSPEEIVRRKMDFTQAPDPGRAIAKR